MRRLSSLAVALLFLLPGTRAPAETPAAKPVRTVLATERLASVVDMPLYLRLYGVRLPAAQRASYSGANAMLYALSGAVAVDIAGNAQSLPEGAGLYVPAAQTATISASGSEPAEVLVFVLTARPNQRRPLLARPANSTELFRTPEALPGLHAGPYEFSLTRVVFPPGMPANPVHYRAGAALYYVLSGTGMFTADGKTEPRPAGTPHFEPFGWVHQWANPGDAPLVLLQANISPEGSPAVVAGQPPTAAK